MQKNFGRFIGRMHLEAVLVDGNALHTGSANVTDAAGDNCEMMFRMVGGSMPEKVKGLLRATIARAWKLRAGK